MEKTYDREEGIQAIIYLQKKAGIVEPRERAERNWNLFSAREKEQTIMVYRIFKKD